MRSRPVIPRAQARKDVDEAVSYYLGEGASDAALSFIDDLEAAYEQIGRHPGSGSLRYGHALDLPGLRAWPLNRFPYLVFYVEFPDRIDVWRVLHGQRNIPATMREPVNS